MKLYNFTKGIRFRLKDVEYEVRKTNGIDVELVNLSYQSLETWDHGELVHRWDEGDLVFKLDPDEKDETIKPDWDLYSDEEKDIMDKRYRILEPWLNGVVLSNNLKAYITSLPDEFKEIASVASLYRWRKRWMKTLDKRSLCPRTELKGPNARKVHPLLKLTIEGIVRKLESEGTYKSYRNLYIDFIGRMNEYNRPREPADQVKPCSKATFTRIAQEIADSYRKDRARHGAVQARLNKHGSTSVVLAERPLERIELDWTPMDLLVVDVQTLKPKRFYLLYGLDKCTGYPLGFHITDKEPDASDWKQCLLHMMLPKTYLKELFPRVQNEWLAYGKPENIIVDNAKVNDCTDIEEVCALLNIGLQYCEVKAGHQKASIERAFRTLNEKVFHGLPGTTFSNPQQKSQYDSQGKACITMLGLYHIIHISLIDLVANDYDTSRGGRPNDLWIQALKETRVQRLLPYNRDDLTVLLCSGVAERHITNKGVEIKGQHYQGIELMELFERLKRKQSPKKIRVRYNTADMRNVYVWDEEFSHYIKVQTVTNGLLAKKIDPRYPVHFEQLASKRLQKSQEYNQMDLLPLSEAQSEIQDITKEEKKHLRKLLSASEEERMDRHYEQLSVIELMHKSLLPPDDLQTLEIIGDETNAIVIFKLE